MPSDVIAQSYNLCLILLVSYEKITAHPIKLTNNIKIRQIINDMCDHKSQFASHNRFVDLALLGIDDFNGSTST